MTVDAEGPFFETLSAQEILHALVQYISRKKPGRIPDGPHRVEVRTSLRDGEIESMTLRFDRESE